MKRLDVFLNEVPVGWLERKGSDTWTFRFLQAYLELAERPVLGQMFEEDLEREHTATLALPPFFSNLLPEGQLRRLLARMLRVNKDREAQLLAPLGRDLPGAVLVLTAEEARPVASPPRMAPPPAPDEQTVAARFRFSLSGVQLKFTAVEVGERWTLPASGHGRKWILKLPDPQFRGLPDAEFSALSWAAQSGIRVPEHRLVEATLIDGLPFDWNYLDTRALAVARFDRTAGEVRVHQEDFSQVVGAGTSEEKDEKYTASNYPTIASYVKRLCDAESYRELIRRFVFMLLSGNADAHLKNWALLYPDGRAARLSPAYDLVPTVVYPGLSTDLALKFLDTRSFRDVDLARFRRLAQRIGHDAAEMAAWVEEDATRIREAWAAVRQDVPMLPEHRAALEAHLSRMSL